MTGVQTCALPISLQGLLAEEARASSALAPKSPPLPAKAKRVIFLFMHGGPSQVDLFDHKPLLTRDDNKPLPFDKPRIVSAKTGNLLASPWKFKQHGESGLWASDLFPHMAGHVDKLCMLHSMHTEGVAHGPATLFLHCGSTNFVRPSMGAWINYGLGSENDNLPGFVSICPSPGNGGARNYGSAFLPPVFQATTMGTAQPDALAFSVKTSSRKGRGGRNR